MSRLHADKNASAVYHITDLYWISMRSLLTILLLIPLCLFAQESDYPQDHLPVSFHKQRREQVREQMSPNTVAVLFSNPVRNRANDVDYEYHQDPDFYYLTGYEEPGSVLLIFSDDQQDEEGNTFNEMVFCRERNPRAEMWTGRRLGVEGVQKLGFSKVVNASNFLNDAVNFDKFEKVLFLGFHHDVRDTRDPADLYNLIGSFMEKTNYANSFNDPQNKIYDYVHSDQFLTNENAKIRLQYMLSSNPNIPEKEQLDLLITTDDPEQKARIIKSIPKPDNKLDRTSLGLYIDKLRGIKSKEEIDLLRKAVFVSCMGQIEVMKAMHSNMSEAEIEGVHEFIFKKYSAEDVGYPSIVGAGQNGCILHYIENNKMSLKNDLVLMDLGAEYRGYTADITRTIPANGKFSPEQRAIYDLVLKAQQTAMDKNCKPGKYIGDNSRICREVVNEGLAELGIIESPETRHNYFPHGVSHHIGLDVHDISRNMAIYPTFEPGMVLTVEPGVYISEGSPCDEKWWGIGVRIEDDILITDDGYELLSHFAPREADEVEKLMQEDNIFSNYELPPLEKSLEEEGK